MTLQLADAWSPGEEKIITDIQRTESVPRIEAIRRMRRRKLDDLRGKIRRRPEVTGNPKSSEPSRAPGRASRLCRNPSCTKGADGGPGSLAHLRAGARFCDDACRKAARRS
jgi:hypothetical protein